MNCKKVQELLLTDYADGQLDLEISKLVKGHLTKCRHCRELAGRMKAAGEPFNRAQKFEPSLAVWQKIKGTIKEEQKSTELIYEPGLWERLRERLFLPKPALAGIFLTAVIVIVFTIAKQPINLQNTAKLNPEEQVEYLSSLVDDFGLTSADDNNGNYGTAIEEFFL